MNRRQMKAKTVSLTKEQRTIVTQAIIDEAKELGQKIFALAICSNHVHIVTENNILPIGRIVSHYKHAGRLALQENGFNGKLWISGFDKRYCMNAEELGAKIAYVGKHES
jgi:REP element-mobilizing transposase RayT